MPRAAQAGAARAGVAESSAHATLRVAVARDRASFRALAPHWWALAASAPLASASQTFDYAWAAWRAGGEREGLAVIHVWRGESLVLVWPLRCEREGGATHVRHPGCGSNEEYAGPLMASDDAEVISAALTLALGLGDVLEVYGIDPKSPLAPRLRRPLAYRNQLLSPCVDLAGVDSFDVWVEAKSGSFRKGLRYDRRRLASQGAVTFALERGATAAEALDWLWAQKRTWADRRGLGKSWLRDPHAAVTFAELAAVAAPAEPLDVVVFTLRLEGAIFAACIALWSRLSLEYLVTGYDPAFERYSPGNLLVEDCVRFAIAHGLDFDFRVTQDAYKLRWADTYVRRETHLIPCTARGVAPVLKIHLRKAWFNTRVALSAVRRRVMRRIMPT